MLEGWAWREERASERLAWQMAYLVNPHLKRAIPYDRFLSELLGPEAMQARVLARTRKLKAKRKATDPT